MADPYVHLKENAWREAEALDAALERGEIGEEEWHRRWQEIVVPAYLGAETPWGQSGKTGTAEDWEWSRSHVADAIDRDGSFLDVGCANGYLMECLPRWTAFRVEPYGLEISSDLAELARSRLPDWAERIFVGNALTWEAPHGFDVVRTEIGYVPARGDRSSWSGCSATRGDSSSGSSTSTPASGRPRRRSSRGASRSVAGASALTAGSPGWSTAFSG
jgi:hypothetical protein